jgi:CDP-paratose 2-epimerase
MTPPFPSSKIPPDTDRRPVLVTGGAGFIGTNLTDRLASAGRQVIVYDNLSRPGVERNIDWLKRTHGDRVTVEVADLADAARLRAAVDRASAVYHFAAQVAVTTSLDAPIADFETNARGTLMLLEAVRATAAPPPLLFTSTNKVYGQLTDLAMERSGERWQPSDPALRARGIGEDRPLDFHSPYGCSKGSADQYVVDYARTYGIPAVVFRMSCIYGPHQCGTEDQGWVAHFLISTLQGRPITLYGDGRQVRDILYVEDLLDAMQLAGTRIAELSGHAFNIGGGPENAVSLHELLRLIEELTGRRPDIGFGPARTGDQLYYVSDTSRFTSATGWRPKVRMQEGVGRLARWLEDNMRVEEGIPRPRQRAAS